MCTLVLTLPLSDRTWKYVDTQSSWWIRAEGAERRLGQGTGLLLILITLPLVHANAAAASGLLSSVGAFGFIQLRRDERVFSALCVCVCVCECVCECACHGKKYKL